jgi:uncharacterized protein DUF6232
MAQNSETVYHPGPRIVVTSRRIETTGGRFLVRDLDEFRCVYQGHPGRRIAMICAGVELAVAVIAAALAGAASIAIAGLVVAAVMGATIRAVGRGKPGWMVLLAEHRGHPVALFSSQNRQEFEQIRRAVLRAVEADAASRVVAGHEIMVAATLSGRSVSSRSPRRPSGRR